MTVPRMHDEEVGVDADLVHRLLAAQLPDLAGLPLTRIEAWGTDHAIFRLGDHHGVRLPKIGWAARQGAKEATWLPLLAPHLPVEVPVPHAVGEPGAGYPFHWYVAPWLDGTNPSPDDVTDRAALAADLAALVLAIQAVGDVVDPAVAPAASGAGRWRRPTPPPAAGRPTSMARPMSTGCWPCGTPASGRRRTRARPGGSTAT